MPLSEVAANSSSAQARIGGQEMEAALGVGHAVARHEDQGIVVGPDLVAQPRQFDLDLVLACLVIGRSTVSTLEKKRPSWP